MEDSTGRAAAGTVIDADYVEEPVTPTSVATIEPTAPSHELVRHEGSTALIVAASPAERVQIAKDVAKALNQVIVENGLRTKIGSKKRLDPHTGEPVRINGREVWDPKWHPNVEAWETMATLLGVAIRPQRPEVVCNPLTNEPLLRKFKVKETMGRGDKQRIVEFEVEGYDWACYCEIVRDGAVIAAGTGVCSRTETKWMRDSDHAVSAMAQTRSIGRAMGAAARWIIALAGPEYSATPAEEMPDMGQEATELPTWALEATPERKTELLDKLAAIVGGDRDGARGYLTVIKNNIGVVPEVLVKFVGGLSLMLPTAAPAPSTPTTAPAKQPQPQPQEGLLAHVPPDEVCECTHPAKRHHANGACMFACSCQGFKTGRAAYPEERPVAPTEEQGVQQALAESLRTARDVATQMHGEVIPPGERDITDIAVERAASTTNGSGAPEKPKPAPASASKRLELEDLLIQAGYSTAEDAGPVLQALTEFFGYQAPEELSERAVEAAKTLVLAAVSGSADPTGSKEGSRIVTPANDVMTILEYSLTNPEGREAAYRTALKELRDWIPF